MSTLAPVAIREQLRAARKENKISLRDLADKCEGISYSDISAYENGKKNPSLAKLEILAAALGREWMLK
ncbi:helix-turn-helix domain-containing protein [Leeuwenhoekiella sp. MAR_2009_132]|uniref:helix-turn-helix domain-containing protein n=1 Tax=Leeuwenhoekiella sp. MAR_2009_132 TaxID=1392489 RepID=UPI000F69234B|nr:helix-turn-helix transcriptional regulator [Leeuwenhoekiella sp. MAR_2009_132]